MSSDLVIFENKAKWSIFITKEELLRAPISNLHKDGNNSAIGGQKFTQIFAFSGQQNYTNTKEGFFDEDSFDSCEEDTLYIDYHQVNQNDESSILMLDSTEANGHKPGKIFRALNKLKENMNYK